MSRPCLYSIDCSRCLCELANCYGASQAQAAATQNLVELGCCKLKKVYALCENFIYTGPLPVLSLGRGSVPGLTGSRGSLGSRGSRGSRGSWGSWGSRDSRGSLSFMTTVTRSLIALSQSELEFGSRPISVVTSSCMCIALTSFLPLA